MRDLTNDDRHCPISLEDWLAVCEVAGVVTVPAEKIVEFESLDLWNCTKPGPHQERLIAAMGIVENSAEPDHMFRWDCCASSWIKSSLATGDWQWEEGFCQLIFMEGDPRFADVLYDWPKLLLPAWKRPWVAAEIYEGFPVEYRVFVKDSEIEGISSYYPQRPLRRDDRELAEVESLTHELIKHAPETPWTLGLDQRQQEESELIPDFFGKNKDKPPAPSERVNFTADFLVTKDGDVLFLEGGPPHELGAHPCCFLPHQIEGVALENRGNPLHTAG